MKFTFGIISTPANLPRVKSIIASIRAQPIPDDCYEIIVVGGDSFTDHNCTHIPFDETKKRAWITKKKNIITNAAKYENIVYLHDYIVFQDGWYDGFLRFGDDWDICMNRILNRDNTRYRDWVIGTWFINNSFPINFSNKEYIIPYDIVHLTKYHYVSGAYWVAKKSVMLANPLDESLGWGEGEDVEWSRVVLNTKNMVYKMNTHSCVKILKSNKTAIFNYMDELTANKLREWMPT